MAEDPKAPEASTASATSAGDASVGLPPSRGGKCPTCNEWLYFEAATTVRPACFRCKKCGMLYRGAPEWSEKSELGPARPFSPPMTAEPRAPEVPAPFALVPDYKWAGKKRRRH